MFFGGFTQIFRGILGNEIKGLVMVKDGFEALFMMCFAFCGDNVQCLQWIGDGIGEP